MVQEQFETGMYVVDKEFHLLNFNEAMAKAYPEVKRGDLCYQSIALRECQCEVCPLRMDNALFYNPLRKEWIYANAAAMEYPGHGECYTIQFQIRQSISGMDQGGHADENMDEHVRELSGGNPAACAIAGYCAPGSPLSYVNEAMVRLLGYDSVEDLRRGVDGLVLNTIHPDDSGRVTADLTRSAQQGGTFETAYRVQRKDRSWFWVVGRGKRVEMASGEFSLLCVITDMTEFVRRQDQLRQQNETLTRKELASQLLMEHMPGGYHRCADAPGWPFLYFGSSFEEVTGWTREEIEGEFQNLFINMVVPEDIPLCAGIIETIQTRGYSNAIYRLKKKGGGYRWVSDSTMRVEDDGEVFFQGTLADVSPQLEALEQARQEAEASNLAKSAFLFNASHDIRTPMNAIKGFSHIIEQNAGDPEMVLTTVKKLQESSDVLLTLMNDVLELSRIERGKDTVNLRPLDMDAHMAKLWDMMAQEMKEHGIRFRMENRILHPLVMADELKLTRIAMNLLSNAKKFTPAGGSVTVGVVESDYDGTGATYTLIVEDTGIGMSEDFQKRAFEQFERERSSTVSGVSGSGLGLAIIKKIADLLGATCTIESRLGQGSRISCSVPLTLADTACFQPEIQPGNVDFRGMRLLLVEDNAFNREIAHYVFESVGFQVEEAVNGVACLEKLTAAEDGYYDLVLMDIQMPVMDGYTATREIRRYQRPAVARVPIIAMTANAFDEDRRRCLEAGMDGYINKPLESQAVLKEFRRILTR